MKKILIALEYNPASQKIAETAYEYAKALQAEIALVHVVADASYYTMEYSPIMGFGGFNTDTTLGQVDELRDQAGSFLAATARHLNDSSIQTDVLEGNPADAILEYAKAWQADLIAMGSDHHRGLEKLLLADVTAHVLKHSAVPVLVIPSVNISR